MTFSNQRPVRILHVVGGMNRGGVETWLMHILRHIDRDRFQMDFLVHTTQPCAYDDEIRALGSKIIPCFYPLQLWEYARNFKRILHEYGPYDIIHSHVHYFSGYVLRLAWQASVPIRVAHSHNDTSSIEAKAGLYRRLYLTLMKQWIRNYATLGLGASRQAAAELFGPFWTTEPRWQVFYCGIDLTPFQDFVNPVTVRAEFGIPADAFVIGHVGRFAEPKNHTFIVDIAAEVARRESRMHLLLVGDGSLHPGIKQKVVQLGLSDRVIFTGGRSDVPRIMLGAMDVFLFPSLHEGLGLVLIEAQAAGLRCIFSDVVPEEADVVKPLVHRMSLLQPASVWADAVMTAKQDTETITQVEAFATVENSLFDIRKEVKELELYYTKQLNQYLEF